MADKMSRINFALKVVPQYDGDTNKLSNFISCVNTVHSLLSTMNPPLDEFEKTIVLLSIKTKIVGKALDSIKDYELKTWNELKTHLQNTFKDKSNSVTILNEILKIQNIKNPYKLMEVTKDKFLNFKSKLGLEQNDVDAKTIVINYIESLLVNNFITVVNDPYRNNLATRNPKTLDDIEQLLQNDFQYLKINNNNNFNKQMPSVSKLPNIPPQQFPKTNFPVGPMHFQSKNATNKAFAPRQNLKNAQLMRPTPMSTQTRQTFQNKSYPRQKNYFEQQNEQFGVHSPNYISKEVHNTENLNENATNINYYNDTEQQYYDENLTYPVSTEFENNTETEHPVTDETLNPFLEFPHAEKTPPDILEN